MSIDSVRRTRDISRRAVQRKWSNTRPDGRIAVSHQALTCRSFSQHKDFSPFADLGSNS